MLKCRFLNEAEFRAADEARIALARSAVRIRRGWPRTRPPTDGRP